MKNDEGKTVTLIPGRYKVGYFPDKDKLIILSENPYFSFFPVEINREPVEINYAPERNFNYNLKRRIYNANPVFTDCEFSYYGLKIGKSGKIYQACEKMA